jgi:hypothetical protein
MRLRLTLGLNIAQRGMVQGVNACSSAAGEWTAV